MKFCWEIFKPISLVPHVSCSIHKEIFEKVKFTIYSYITSNISFRLHSSQPNIHYRLLIPLYYLISRPQTELNDHKVSLHLRDSISDMITVIFFYIYLCNSWKSFLQFTRKNETKTTKFIGPHYYLEPQSEKKNLHIITFYSKEIDYNIVLKFPLQLYIFKQQKALKM